MFLKRVSTLIYYYETIVTSIRTCFGNLPIVRPPLHNIYGIYPSNEWPSLSTRASQQAFRLKHHWTGSPRIVCHIGGISQTHHDISMLTMHCNGCKTSWSIRILLLLVNSVRLAPWGYFLSYFLRCRKWKWIRKQRFSVQTTHLRLVPCRQWWPRASVPTARDPSQPPRRGRCTSSRSPERKL